MKPSALIREGFYTGLGGAVAYGLLSGFTLALVLVLFPLKPLPLEPKKDCGCGCGGAK
jgi:hypothetical protein